MATFDEIFTKSNLEESKRKAKMLFGRILISLRKNNHIKLYSLLESVNETDIKNGEFQIVLSDKTAFNMMNNNTDLAVLQDTLNTVQEGLVVKVSCNGKEPFDMQGFEHKLKEEFGKLLTIKK